MNDLEWDYEDIPYEVTGSFNSFMEEYNRIYGFLNIIQGVTFDTNNLEAPVKDVDELSNQLDDERPKYDELINCGKKMSEKFPFLADDILCRVELLAVKWEILQIFLLSQRPNGQKKDDESDLGSDSQFSEKCFHDWLSSVEDKIVPVKFKINWSAKAIKQKKNEMKIIQEDIVSQGQIVRSLIKSSKHREESKIRQLEERWHKVWLRCLEWQCLLEGLGSTPKDELVKFDRPEDSTYDVRSVATETEMSQSEEYGFDDATMATMDSSMDSSKTYACLKIGEDQSDLASCDASDENSSRGNRSSDESEDGDDINATLTRESDVTHPGIDGNKEVEIIEFWDQESYLSEHHYDEPRIDDSSLNMLNFGDDYRNYIDSLSEDENDLDDIPRRPRMPFGLVTEDSSKKQSSSCDPPPTTGEEDLSIYTEAFKKSSLEFRRKKEKVLPLLRSLEQCKVSMDELNSAKCVCKESELELTSLRNAAKTGKECMLLSGLISRWNTLGTCIEDGIRLGNRVLETCHAINHMKMSLHQMLDEEDEALEMEFKHYAPNLMRMQNEIFTLNISLHEIIHELQSVVSLLERRAKAPRVEFQKIQQKMLELYSLWEQVHQRLTIAEFLKPVHVVGKTLQLATIELKEARTQMFKKLKFPTTGHTLVALPPPQLPPHYPAHIHAQNHHHPTLT
ncbi:uncharacterized protein LOC131891073 isoform X2 [Tigriopus californicus]|uniref:uncharacterized protein LOC131891073 isoform X2 n=1 Tax=Tigriopus californicus TaxID=6832 RepID=UPI0027DA4905|nr:uncharacterized protein LOC131891073 isoform X2 [Tigriopus californicus]